MHSDSGIISEIYGITRKFKQTYNTAVDDTKNISSRFMTDEKKNILV